MVWRCTGSVPPTGKITKNTDNSYQNTLSGLTELEQSVLRELNKRFNSRFCVGFPVRHNTLEIGRRAYRPKISEYNDDTEDNSLNILSDKNHQASYQILSK